MYRHFVNFYFIWLKLQKKKNLYWFDPIKKQKQIQKKKIEIEIKIKKNKQINNISKVQSKLN